MGVMPIDPLAIEAIRASGTMVSGYGQVSTATAARPQLQLTSSPTERSAESPERVAVPRGGHKDIVTDYYEVIKEPMDLSTMGSKLELDQYETPKASTGDAKLILDNCRKYNHDSTSYVRPIQEYYSTN